MTARRLWVIVGLLAACHGAAPDAVPAPVTSAPVPAGDTALTVALNPADTGDLTEAPALDSIAPADSDPDSTADAAILEQLATAHPEALDSGLEAGDDNASPGGANSAAAPVTYDIDVETYGTHQRVQYYLDFFQGPARERMSVWLRRMPRYEPMIRAKLKENGVPEDMVYLALIESGYSNSAVSRARATGMWQFMRGTAKLYGLRVDSWVDERRDPVRATDAAARHLADLRDRFGSMYLAAAAYNAGAGKVGRGLRRMGDDDEEDEENPDAAFFRLYDTRFLRRETKDYVPKLIAAALIAKQPEKYGFEVPADVDALSYDSVIVHDATGLDVLARLADTSVAALRELNPQFLRGVTPPRTNAIVRLPPGTGEEVTAGYATLPATSRVSFVEHTVSRGQTMASIAAMYHVSTRMLQEANPGARSTRLRIGERLVIPTSYVPPVTEPARTTRRGSSSSTATIRYRVRSGETLSEIAGQYHTTVTRLRSLNAMGSRDILRAGQVIRVPAPAAPVETTPATVAAGGTQTHLVRRGDTLGGIAKRYGVTISALRAANGLGERDVIKAGSRLTIP